MTPDETLAQATQQFDIINKAAHYNKHPSGVECIELAERLGFNTGNAFKYVFRRGDKGNTAQDLEKAIYYLKREAKQLQSLIRWRTVHEVEALRCNEHFTKTDVKNIRKVYTAEPDTLAAAVYSRIFARDVSITGHIEGLTHAVEYVERMIQEILNPVSEPEPPANSGSTVVTHRTGDTYYLPQN